jgi:hypothetical protein
VALLALIRDTDERRRGVTTTALSGGRPEPHVIIGGVDRMPEVKGLLSPFLLGR